MPIQKEKKKKDKTNKAANTTHTALGEAASPQSVFFIFHRQIRESYHLILTLRENTREVHPQTSLTVSEPECDGEKRREEERRGEERREREERRRDKRRR